MRRSLKANIPASVHTACVDVMEQAVGKQRGLWAFDQGKTFSTNGWTHTERKQHRTDLPHGRKMGKVSTSPVTPEVPRAIFQLPCSWHAYTVIQYSRIRKMQIHIQHPYSNSYVRPDTPAQ